MAAADIRRTPSTLKTVNNRYVWTKNSANDYHVRQRTSISNETKLTPSKAGKKWQFKTHHTKYLRARSNNGNWRLQQTGDDTRDSTFFEILVR